MDYSILLDKLTDSINATSVLSIMTIVVSSTVGIFLAVWGGKVIIKSFEKVFIEEYDSSYYNPLTGITEPCRKKRFKQKRKKEPEFASDFYDDVDDSGFSYNDRWYM